jgi:2-polyprenyl-3-methyl-5-hydroxy-6-metoxy-1,4-benzoquinol methylase
MLTTCLRACPLCQGTTAEVLHRQAFVLPDDSPLPRQQDVVCCRRCEFVYADTPLSQTEYDSYYRDVSRYADAATATGSGRSEQDALRLGALADSLVPFAANRNARILDVGCAAGGLLRCLGERGFTSLTGLDPAPGCIAVIGALPGVRGVVGSLVAKPAGLGSFDLVTAVHVLEHVRDLQRAGEALLEWVRPDGTLYVEVPDATRYHEALAAPFQEFNTEHINHFSPTTLTRFLAGWGFAPLRIEQTSLPVAPLPYPVIAGWFRRVRQTCPLPSFESGLREPLRLYVERSTELLRKFDERLHGLLDEAKAVIVWGAGELAHKLLAETVLGRAPIAAFVDANPVKQGRTLRGVPIVEPQAARHYPDPILIASTMRQHDIARTIREELGMPNRLLTLAPT